MDHEIVDLTVLSMKQNGVTSCAREINRVRARDQDGRGAYDRAADRSQNRLKANSEML